MSFDSHTIIEEENEDDNNSLVSYNRRNAHLGSNILYTSSVVLNLRQLQTDLHAQHQHEKVALNELNQRFHLFVDRAHQLQIQNSKYLTEIVNHRRQSSGFSSADLQWTEHHHSQKSDLATVCHAKVDCESDFDLFQLHIGIYQQLIDVEQHWKDKRYSKLEDELKHTASNLHTLRISCTELDREIESLYAERTDIFNQYLTVTHDWCLAKKQRKKWNLNVETLKSYVLFYKNLRSHSGRGFESTSVQSHDVTQFWRLELEKTVKRMRRDFEVFYGTIHRELTAYYNTKLEEMQTDVQPVSHHQEIDIEEFTMRQHKRQVEYEEVQKSLSYEQQILHKLEHAYSQLTAEFKSIQHHHQEQSEVQSRDLHILQESLMDMICDVDDIRRSKANLEGEIIVYHNLLDSSEIDERVSVVHRTQPVESKTMEKYLVKKQKKGWIDIKKCAPSGTYISLVNHSTSKDIDISRWMLKQHIDSKTKLRYTIPDGVRLHRNSELRIYARRDGDESSAHHRVVSSATRQELVNNDLVSWGIGHTIETILFNQNGDEEASYLQSLAS